MEGFVGNSHHGPSHTDDDFHWQHRERARGHEAHGRTGTTETSYGFHGRAAGSSSSGAGPGLAAGTSILPPIAANGSHWHRDGGVSAAVGLLDDASTVGGSGSVLDVDAASARRHAHHSDWHRDRDGHNDGMGAGSLDTVPLSILGASHSQCMFGRLLQACFEVVGGRDNLHEGPWPGSQT